MIRWPRATSRLAVFGLVLFGVFGTAYAAGERLPGHSHVASTGHHTTADESQPHTHDLTPKPAVTATDGYELRLDPVAADGHRLQYRVVGADGATVTSFLDDHGSMLHTVLIRSDLSGFAHIHPELRGDGTWQVTVPTGAWHLVFELWPQGATSSIVLATNTDDEVPTPAVALPAPDDAPTVDGLTVRRDGMTFTVTDATGAAATNLEPYLGAAGHLIAIRQGDLGFTHLHPTTTGAAAGAPAMTDMPGMVDMPTAVAGSNGSGAATGVAGSNVATSGSVAAPSGSGVASNGSGAATGVAGSVAAPAGSNGSGGATGVAGSNVLAFSGQLSAGTYRLFLQFGHAGAVVTVPYTVVVP